MTVYQRKSANATGRLQVSDSINIRKEIAALQNKLKQVSRTEKIESLRGDVRLLDYMDKVSTAFTAGDIDAARKNAGYLWRGLNSEAISPATMNFAHHFEKYKSTGTAIKMPQEWGFAGKKELELERGLIYPIGAKPGTGKSTVAINLAYYWAYQKAAMGYRVAFLTNEMKEGQLWVKLYQVHLNLQHHMRRPFMLAKDWLRYPEKFPAEHKAMREFAKMMSDRLVFVNVRKMSAEDICIVIDETKNHFMVHPDIIVLDYLQRIPRNSAFKSEERLGLIDTVQMFSDKMGDIDGIMFVLSQMNETSGFKGSAAPEEEAGIAWEISRDTDREGKKMPLITWKVKKSRISPYVTVNTGFDDTSGTILGSGWDGSEPETF